MLGFVKNHWITVVIVLTAILGIFSYSNLLDSDPADRDKKTLVVGLQSGYPPFEFLDSTGDIVGFDIDIAKHLADKLHKKLVIKELDFESLISLLKQGKVDIIVSGMCITPNRLEEIAMVPYHGTSTSSLRLLFWKEIPEGIKSLRDVASLPLPTVSVETGTICETVLLNQTNIVAKQFQGSLDPLIDVKEGKSVATLVEPDVAEYLQEMYPEVQSLHVYLNQDEQIKGFGIGIKKSHALLVHQITEAIDGLKESGVLKQMEEKWFKGGHKNPLEKTSEF